jgi:hypothetical protein
MRKRARRVPAFLKKKKGEELTKGGTRPLLSTETRHPLPSDGTAIGGWDLLFLWRDHDKGLLRDWGLLFLRWDHNSLRLRQRDLLFNNVLALHVGDLLFIVHNMHRQLEWRDQSLTAAVEAVA